MDIQTALGRNKDDANNIIKANYNKSLENEQRMYKEMIDKTNKSVKKIEDNIKISDDILLYVHRKVDEKFNKDLLEKEIKNINFKEKTLDEIKKE